ncbi:MAG TPA: NYN domain-containing protein [Longimicrobium sp.]|uniref:NYN domain-containing protein n=1 Tax=Longimicrobium sp. TaxID=2029185 RepID=UPI002EDABB67
MSTTADARRTWVYIDGFNLFYGSLKGTQYRWLDIAAFSRLLLPKNSVERVKYFTARVAVRGSNPQAAARQRTYLRALATLPEVETYYGHYLSHVHTLPLASATGDVITRNGRTEFARVLRDEEKGSDVNLASHLLHDAHLDRFDVAVVITNDSDLVTPIDLVTRDLGLVVGVVNPHAENPRSRQSVQLRQVASFLKPVRAAALRKCQLPATLADRDGPIHKPRTW